MANKERENKESVCVDKHKKTHTWKKTRWKFEGPLLDSTIYEERRKISFSSHLVWSYDNTT